MTMRLAVQITADAGGVRAGTSEASREFDKVGATLRGVDQDARRVSAALNEVGRSSRQAAIDASIGVRNDFGGAARAADIAIYGRALDDLRAKYNPLFAAQRQYIATLAEIRQAEKAGALSAREAAAAIERSKAAFAGAVPGLRGARGNPAAPGAGARLEPHQLVNLQYQVNDVFTSISSGMNPLTVLLQQGPQITQVFGGVRQTLSAIAGVLTPVRIGLGGVAGAAIAGAMAWSEYLASTKEVETANAGLGRSAGTTAAELEAIAQASAAAGSVSIAQARSMEAAFLRTGRIGGGSFKELIGISKDFAATLSTDLDTASGKLADLFADPARGAEQLRQLGLLDGATARLVQRLSAQNETTRAQSVLLEGMRPRLADAAEATTFWGRAWDQVARSASNAAQSVGQALDRATGGDNTLERQLAYSVASLEALNRRAVRLGVADPAGRPILEAQIADLQEQLRRQRQLAERRAIDAQQDRTSTAAIESASGSPANEEAERRRKLEAELRRSRAGAGLPGQTADEQANIARAIDARSRALATLMPASERQAELDRLDLQIQTARDPVTRADLAARRERVALAGEEITTAEAETRVQQARARVIAEALATSKLHVADLADETAARRRVNDAVAAGTISLSDADRQMQLDAELRLQIRSAMAAEGEERKALVAGIDRLREAYASAASEQSRSAALSVIAGQRDQGEALRLEIALIGQSADVRARATAAMEAEQRIRQAGISANSAEAAAIRANARAIADLGTTLERQRDAWSTYVSAGESALDTLGDAISGQKVEWQDVARDIQRTFLQLSIVNPLKNALFGTNYGTLGDLGSVFGIGGGPAKATGGSSVGTMTVTAASVVVNGAIGSGVAGLATPSAAALTGSIDKISSLNDSFEKQLKAFLDAAKGSGFDISVNSGYRSVERQQQLWNDALAKYGSADIARQWVAPPGKSMHNYGMAADLGYGSDAARSWAQQNASSYGLTFPLGNEPWHVEPVGGRDATAGLQQQAQAFSGALETATTAASNFGSGVGDASKGAQTATTGISTSAVQLSDATKSAATTATSFTGGLGGAFSQILGGLGQIGSGFISGFGGILNSILGGLGGAGGSGGNILSSLGSMFGFADGGVMTSRGPLPLHRYAMGGVAASPQLALFGEGRNPEAFVPLPDGRRIPVALSMPKAGNDNTAFMLAASLNKVSEKMAAAASAAPAPIVNIISAHPTAQISTVQKPDARGGVSLDVQIDEAMAASAAKPGGRFSRELQLRGMGTAVPRS